MTRAGSLSVGRGSSASADYLFKAYCLQDLQLNPRAFLPLNLGHAHTEVKTSQKCLKHVKQGSSTPSQWNIKTPASYLEYLLLPSLLVGWLKSHTVIIYLCSSEVNCTIQMSIDLSEGHKCGNNSWTATLSRLDHILHSCSHQSTA